MKSLSILFSIFFLISSLINAAFVEAGYNHTLFLDHFGQMWAVGNNDHGQLGIRDAKTLTNPTLIPFEGIVKTIAAGNQTSYAIDDQGRLWAWGKNDLGELGFGHSNRIDVPTCMDELPKIAKISPGPVHTLAVDENGGVWRWNVSKKQIWGPVEWENMFVLTSILTVLMDKEGRVWIFEAPDNAHEIMSKRIPKKPSLLDIAHTFSIFQGDIHNIERIGNLEVKIDRGQQAFTLSPAGIMPSTDYGPEYTHAASGFGRIFCRDKNGKLWAKGQNQNGELGLGNTGYQSEWAQVMFP